MISANARNRFGLPFSERHNDLLIGTPYTVCVAVARFIETEAYAADRFADTIKRLRRNNRGRKAAEKLSACRHDKLSGQFSNCSICARSYRAWLNPQVIAYAQLGVKVSIVSVLIREVAEGYLRHVDLATERDALRKRLTRCGFKACIGNLEVAYKPERHAWGVHAHLVIFGPSKNACEKLKEKIDLPRAVERQHVSPDHFVQALTYQFKFVTYYVHPSSDRKYPLPDDALAELCTWRMNLRLLDHLISIGFQRRGSIIPGPAFRRLLAGRPSSGDVETWRPLRTPHHKARPATTD